MAVVRRGDGFMLLKSGGTVKVNTTFPNYFRGGVGTLRGPLFPLSEKTGALSARRLGPCTAPPDVVMRVISNHVLLAAGLAGSNPLSRWLGSGARDQHFCLFDEVGRQPPQEHPAGVDVVGVARSFL
jgi:hypothetical protein